MAPFTARREKGNIYKPHEEMELNAIFQIRLQSIVFPPHTHFLLFISGRLGFSISHTSVTTKTKQRVKPNKIKQKSRTLRHDAPYHHA